MDKSVIKHSLLLLVVGILAGCQPQQTSTSEQQQPTYEQNYVEWYGPGWYYGVYFYNRGAYYNWRRYPSHRYHHRRGSRYYHGRGHREGRHHGGGHRGGGGQHGGHRGGRHR